MRRGWITRTRYDATLHDLQEARERLANAHAAAATAQSALNGGGNGAGYPLPWRVESPEPGLADPNSVEQLSSAFEFHRPRSSRPGLSLRSPPILRP
jgi:hypothetical protein